MFGKERWIPSSWAISYSVSPRAGEKKTSLPFFPPKQPRGGPSFHCSSGVPSPPLLVFLVFRPARVHHVGLIFTNDPKSDLVVSDVGLVGLPRKWPRWVDKFDLDKGRDMGLLVSYSPKRI